MDVRSHRCATICGLTPFINCSRTQQVASTRRALGLFARVRAPLPWWPSRRVHQRHSYWSIGFRNGDWSEPLLRLSISQPASPSYPHRLDLSLETRAPYRPRTISRHPTNLPACHDTASAIASIPTSLERTAYICSGTVACWHVTQTPITSPKAMDTGFTNQGAAGGFCFHTNVNGMWILKQCLDTYSSDGRPWDLQALIERLPNATRFRESSLWMSPHCCWMEICRRGSMNS
jgi:hypothetical protein